MTQLRSVYTLRSRATQIQRLSHPDQIRQRFRRHLSHDVAAVNLHGDLGHAQLVRDLDWYRWPVLARIGGMFLLIMMMMATWWVWIPTILAYMAYRFVRVFVQVVTERPGDVRPQPAPRPTYSAAMSVPKPAAPRPAPASEAASAARDAAFLISLYAGCGFIAKFSFAALADWVGPRVLMFASLSSLCSRSS